LCDRKLSNNIKAYADLLRLHFFFVWPMLFSAGLFFGFILNGSFSLILVLQATLIAFFGFEAGLVLNDVVDANLDKKELPSEKKLTKYWRPFGRRPLYLRLSHNVCLLWSGSILSNKEAK
jgi:4-hydroxybenzoate polyprenyltransferase